MSLSAFHGIFGALNTLPGETTGDTAPVPTKQPTQRSTQTGQIAVDIFEQENYYIIRAPIAGVRLSDLDIEVDDKVITIRGTRKPNEEIADDQFYLRECFWGAFSRSITLPCQIDPKRVKATFSKDSILKILIPKEEKIKIIRINEGT